MIEEVEKGPVLDAGLIGAAQKVEHYEIATYGTLCALAKQLGYTEAMQLLRETLEEEKSTDEKLTLLAESGGNAAAADAKPQDDKPAPARRAPAKAAAGKTAKGAAGSAAAKPAAPAPRKAPARKTAG
jgi:rubrerythrin